jgi:hypothetical protein
MLWTDSEMVDLVSHNPSSKIYPNKMKDDLIHVRDDCLGPKELRTRAGPTKLGQAYHGGTRFERSERANPVKPGTRCYTIGNTFEGPTKIMAPCKDGKMGGDGDTEALHMRSQLLKARSFKSSKHKFFAY